MSSCDASELSSAHRESTAAAQQRACLAQLPAPRRRDCCVGLRRPRFGQPRTGSARSCVSAGQREASAKDDTGNHTWYQRSGSQQKTGVLLSTVECQLAATSEVQQAGGWKGFATLEARSWQWQVLELFSPEEQDQKLRALDAIGSGSLENSGFGFGFGWVEMWGFVLPLSISSTKARCCCCRCHSAHLLAPSELVKCCEKTCICALSNTPRS